MKTNYKSKHEKACLKRCVLRSVLKQLRSITALIFDGNLFQSLGADARTGPYLFYIGKFITQFKATQKNDSSPYSFSRKW